MRRVLLVPVRSLLAALVLLGLAPSTRAAFGGPDSFGYTWVDGDSGCSNATGTFGAGAVTATSVTALQGPYNLGFAFPYFGQLRSQVWVSPAGYVLFNAGANTESFVQLPAAANPNDMIAVHWTTMEDATITSEATPGQFHVRWVQRLTTTGLTMEFHLFLMSDGSFRMTWRGSFDVPRSVGYENAGTPLIGTNLFYDPSTTNGDEVIYPGLPEPGTQDSICITPPVMLDCSAPLTVDCNGSVSGTLPATDPSPASVYSCTGTAYLGNERVVNLTVTTPQQVSVSIDNAALDILQIGTGACAEDNCVRAGGDRIDFPILFPGTYAFVVDKTASGGGDAFRFSATCADPFDRIGCGDRLPGSTTGSGVFTTYTCTAAALDGPESLYRLTLATQQNVVATLQGAPAGLWVVLYDAASFDSGGPCTAAGRGGAGVFDAPAGDYVIVVDGEAGASGSYTLAIDCGPQLDCGAARPLSCASRVSGNTSASPSDVSVYNCAEEALTGGEDIYAFVNPVEQTIEARFVSSTPGQRLLLLPACGEGECLLTGVNGVSCSLFPPGSYFLIVDGTSSGPYEIELSCSEIYTGVDLRVASIDTSALAVDCSTFDVNAVTRVDVANLGDTDAPGGFSVVVFEDRAPLNGTYDAGIDNLLGRSTIAGGLPRGQTITVDVATMGTVAFRDNVVYAEVDPDGMVAEVLEDNNVFDTGRGCEYRPPVGVFTPTVEWEWNSSPDMSDYLAVDTVPLVADMDLDGTPDIVINTGQRPGGFADGVVRALDGRTGRELFTAIGTDVRVDASSNLALANLDSLPHPEIVGISNVTGSTDTLVAINWLGLRVWTSDPLVRHPVRPGGNAADGGGAPFIADLDCDGLPEVIYGANVFGPGGNLINAPPDPVGTLGINAGGDGSIAIAVDIDGVAGLEVVAGPTAYRYEPTGTTMSIIWQNPSVPDGYAAAGNFDDDPLPEIAITASGTMYMLEGDTGALKWSRQIPRGGGGCMAGAVAGGPPTIADFDGDCEAEVGVSGADWYTVFETDGTIRWRAPIDDCSSHRTASTVFDFDGDGAAEVAFADQTTLHIFNGSDGSEITSVAASSHTWTEMVSVADVDGDNNAEIVLPLNPPNGGLTGIRVIGDADDNWVNTRRIWNQHQYHINNINDDGSVPGATTTRSCELPSHRLHNTYRDQLGSAVYAAPDITISLTAYEIELVNVGGNCVRQVRIQARVGNGGGISVGAPFTAWFYKEDATGARENLVSQVISDLQPGEFTDFEVVVPDPGVGSVDIFAVADDDGAGNGLINECREDNNVCATTVENDAVVIDPPAPLGPALRVTEAGDPNAPDITALLSWPTDAGLPRPAGDHYHLYRSVNDRGRTLSRVAAVEPITGLSHVDSTPRATVVVPPNVHYYKIVPADDCEQEPPPEPRN